MSAPAIATFLEEWPLILGPISTHPPFRAGQADLAPGAVRRTIRGLRLTWRPTRWASRPWRSRSASAGIITPIDPR